MLYLTQFIKKMTSHKYKIVCNTILMSKVLECELVVMELITYNFYLLKDLMYPDIGDVS
jgi:hypothetical protein